MNDEEITIALQLSRCIPALPTVKDVDYYLVMSLLSR